MRLDDERPERLSELGLLVLPSHTEGLPNIITDAETSFATEGNSLECIVHNVARASNYPKPEQITSYACALVEREFTYETAEK